jgi:biotin transport system ATP-binding protein
MRPSLIVFDEPFSSQDLTGVRRILSQIVSLHVEGYTVIVVTHELEKVLAHATRLIIMDGGRVAEDGEPGALLDTLEAHRIRRPSQTGGIREMTWMG